MRSRRSAGRHRYSATGRGVDREAVEGSARPLSSKWEIMVIQEDHPRGIDNVLADLGFDDAEKLSAKTVFAVNLNELIDKRGLSQPEVARLTGMTQPKVSQVRCYKLQNISLERLMQALVSLDQHVEIVVRPAQGSHTPGIEEMSQADFLDKYCIGKESNPTCSKVLDAATRNLIDKARNSDERRMN
jgi:predicted XRE-type DNA-binding protein